MKWRKARKKPIIVEVREVEPRENLSRCASTEIVSEPLMGEVIETREGRLHAYVGKDFIIRGVEGEVYPIDKKIFEKTYEWVTEVS